MGRSLMHRNIYSFRLFAFFLFISATYNASIAKADEEYIFPAFGTVWRAYNINWVEIEKRWLIGATIDVVRPSNRGLTAPQMLAAFCKQLVQMRPNFPGKASREQKIFRVDLNVIATNKRPVWPTPVPVRVRADECQVKEGSQQFFIKYPGSLDGWRFHSAIIQKAGEIYRRQYTFEPDEGANVKIREFDFDLACRATLNDPTIKKIQASVERQHADKAIEPATVVIVAKQATKRGFKQGMFFGYVYKTVGGRCVKK